MKKKTFACIFCWLPKLDAIELLRIWADIDSTVRTEKSVIFAATTLSRLHDAWVFVVTASCTSVWNVAIQRSHSFWIHFQPYSADVCESNVSDAIAFLLLNIVCLVCVLLDEPKMNRRELNFNSASRSESIDNKTEKRRLNFGDVRTSVCATGSVR